MDHARVDALVARNEALGERPGLVIHVPVERFGENATLRRVQSQRVDILDEDEQPREVLSALDDAELGRLLDRVARVAAGVGETDDLRLRRLRLQQERGEILRIERCAYLAENLAAVLQHDRLGVALERIPERIIRGEKEPGVAAALEDRAAGA